MSTVNIPESHELVVAGDGSIHADQLARLGLRPGSHLQVVRTDSDVPSGSLRGLLPDLPDLTWDDFEMASKATQADIEASVKNE